MRPRSPAYTNVAPSRAPASPLSHPGALLRVIPVAFFFSGISALFYQIIWLRHLSTVFGNTTLAISVTLTAFMAGLAAGAYAFGRWADAVARPFRLYAWLEILIGLYGLASLSLLRLVHLGYIALAARLALDSPWLVSFQFWASFLVLLLPTALMGGTLPVASKGCVRRLDAIAPAVGKLYGVNTFGAAAGVLLVGFFLLPVLGLRGSVALAAVINLAVGAAVLRLDAGGAAAPTVRAAPGGGSDRGPDASSGAPSMARALVAVLVIGFALSGFSGLALEVVWTRALSLYIGCSVYAFSAVLLAVLVGIAAGSMVVARAAAAAPITVNWFAAAQLGAGISTLALIAAYNPLAFAFLRLVRDLSEHFGALLLFEVLLIVGCLVAPTLCSGAALPILSRIYVRREAALARGIGFIYAANTLGCIVGAFAAGFILIPWIGLRATALLCAGFYMASGAAVLFFGASPRRLVGAASLAALAAAVALMPSWRPELMSAGFFRAAMRDLRAPVEYVEKERKIIFHREGALATVAVAQADESRALVINGKVDASDSVGDMDTQTLSAHLPLLLAERPRDVLVIGLGSGTTSGAAALHPVRRIDCIEIEPAVAQAARYFRHINRDVFSDPRFHLIPADARNYVAACRRRYDVIISEPSNPWVAGVASLFTVEHFQALRQRLAADGMVCQWIHLYHMGEPDLASVVASFVKVFPNATMWWTSRSHVDVALIARPRPWKVDFPRLAARIAARRAVRQDLRRALLDSPEALLSYIILGPADLHRLAEIGLLNTDDLPRLEFSAPRNVYREQATESNWLLLASHKRQAFDEIVDLGAAARDPATWQALAQALLTRHAADLQSAFYLGWIRDHFAAAIARAPRRADLYESLARVEVLLGDSNAARSCLLQALELEPGRASARDLLARIGG